MRDLDAVFKAYDIRGLVPEQLDEKLANALGAAFARFAEADSIVLARDMRLSSKPLATAFAEGVIGQGTDVIDIGWASTDMLYYASGSLAVPGAMFTASHNPASYNGIKLCLAGARPVGRDSGLTEIRTMVEYGTPPGNGPSGQVSGCDLLSDYAGHLRALVDLSGIRPLKVVADAGNGMAGYTVPAAFAGLPITLVPLYLELDGAFPHHEPNPIEPANLRDLQRAVTDNEADLGLAFDGDADRCFVVDERGHVVSPSALTALVAARELAREPGAVVIHNLITSRRVPEIVRAHGGVPLRTRVGHSFIKARMAESGAVFGGEHSGHFYFRDFWFADSGLLAAFHVLAALGGQPAPLSELLDDYAPYPSSGELNTAVADQDLAIAQVRVAFAARPRVRMDNLDGLTVSTDAWWFNLRPSNTEPLLRLNVEATDERTMVTVRNAVLRLLRTAPEAPPTQVRQGAAI